MTAANTQTTVDNAKASAYRVLRGTIDLVLAEPPSSEFRGLSPFQNVELYSGGWGHVAQHRVKPGDWSTVNLYPNGEINYTAGRITHGGHDVRLYLSNPGDLGQLSQDYLDELKKAITPESVRAIIAGRTRHGR